MTSTPSVEGLGAVEFVGGSYPLSKAIVIVPLRSSNRRAIRAGATRFRS